MARRTLIALACVLALATAGCGGTADNLGAGASDSVPDKQGRVTVPQPLRDYAGLSRDCVVIGAGARLEVWDAQAWDTYLADRETAFADQSEEVLPGLI